MLRLSFLRTIFPPKEFLFDFVFLAPFKSAFLLPAKRLSCFLTILRSRLKPRNVSRRNTPFFPRFFTTSWHELWLFKPFYFNTSLLHVLFWFRSTALNLKGKQIKTLLKTSKPLEQYTRFGLRLTKSVNTSEEHFHFLHWFLNVTVIDYSFLRNNTMQQLIYASK